MAGRAGDPHRFMTSNQDRSLTRMLFIGNSFTTRNQLPRLLAGIAAAVEHPRRIEFDTIWAGGASLRRHWNAGKAQEAVATSAWDCVVLQERSTLPLKNPKRYHENVRLFDAEIAKHGARTVLYLTWSRRHAPETQSIRLRAQSRTSRQRSARTSSPWERCGTQQRNTSRVWRSMPTTAAIRPRSDRIWRRACSL
jgi:hypothetical protein